MIKNFIIAGLSVVVLAEFSSSTPRKFEYFISNDQSIFDIKSYNQLGDQGWEYCGIHYTTRFGGAQGVYKRMK